VLADKPKVEMEDEIREKVGDSRRTRIVCRHGQPMDPADLEIANLASSKSIIVLAPEDSDKDTTVIKTLLAIIKGNGSAGLSQRIVAELAERKNLEVANIVTSGQSELMLSGELIARITAQTCRQSGLSVIYGDLLDFAGDEIYFQAEPGLVGQTFGEALHAYDDSAIIGLRPAGGHPLLNPPMDTCLSAGDELIAISQDDDTVAANATLPPAVDESLIQPAGRRPRAAEHTLLLGWNHRARVIIEELDRYIAPGSQLTVLADSPLAEVELADLTKRVQRMVCHFSRGDTTDRTVLDGLDLTPVDHVIVLATTRNRSQQQADAATLVTLLHLRDIADRHNLHFSIVSEILDIRTRDLAEGSRADDFIVSDRLASLVLAQISENKQLGAVFADLFGPSGSEIYLRPVADYVASGVEMNFHTVVEAARRRGQVAIGYRVRADSRQSARNYGVVLNPVKSSRLSFAKDDQVVVLAED
jgi:voltage-gated potassium channel Kch